MGLTVFSGLVMLWRLAGKDLAIVSEGDHRRRGAAALSIFDHPGLVSFHHGNARVGGSEIDANCLRHDQAPSSKDACKRFRRFRLCSINMRDAAGASGGKTASASRGRLGGLKRRPYPLAWPLPYPRFSSARILAA